MRSSVRAELLKLRKRPAVRVLIGIWLVTLLAFGYLFPYLGYRNGGSEGRTPAELLPDLLPAHFSVVAVQGTPMFGGALALILGALLTGSDHGWGTMKTALTQGPRRVSILGGQLVTLAGLLAVLVAAGLALAAGTSAVIASAESAPAVWPSIGTVARAFASGWLIVSVSCLIGVALGTVLRGTAMAIGLGLVWALVIENLFRGLADSVRFMDAIARGLPGANAGSLLAGLGARLQSEPGGTPGVVDIASGGAATSVLLAYGVALVGVTAVLLHRRDVA